jgi:sugar phosphate isomerase/epimerase
MIKLGVQMFSIRKEFDQDPQQTLRDLKAIGFTSLELAMVLGGHTAKGAAAIAAKEIQFGFKTPKSILTPESALETVDFCHRIGLDAVSAHLFLADAYQGYLTDITPEIIAFAAKTGIRSFVVSYMLDSKAGCDKFAGDISSAIAALSEHNITICYHNHDMEMKKIDGEQTVLEYLLSICDERLKIQLDIGWCYAGGVDVLGFMAAYSEKIVSLHLKDFKTAPPEGQKWDSFCAIGEGIVPTEQALLASAVLKLIDNGIIIDQDDAESMMADLKIGYQNVSEFLTNA